MSDQDLFAAEVDPIKLAQRLRAAVPDNLERAGLSAEATQLYEIVLDECCVCFTQLVIQLQPFTNRGIAELLSRTSGPVDKIDDVLARLPVRPLAREGDEDCQFLDRYLGHLSNTLDDLELYGVDVRRWLRELLTAYSETKVVVTSRPAAAADRWLAGEGFGTATLERMNPADLRVLVRQWHEAVRAAGDLPCAEHELPRYEAEHDSRSAGSMGSAVA